MIELSRRTLVAGGAIALGSLAGAAAAFGPRASKATAEAVAVAAQRPSVVRLGPPTQVASLLPTTTGSVMQQVERLGTGELVITQAVSGSAPGRDTTVISRFGAPADPFAPTPELDSMTIVDGGHGLGLHVEPRGDGGRDVWMSLQGPFWQGDPSGGRLARFAYTPGTYDIAGIPGGVTYLPQFTNLYGEQQEAVYGFDWAEGVAVERMYDFHTGRHERYTRRRIADIVRGVDRPRGRMTVPVNPPTMQGFATVGGSLFRWVGVANAGSGAVVPTDPMAMEQFDWATGERVAITPFPTLGQDATGTWRDGAYEPEGCSVVRQPDGSAALLVGVVVGRSGDHGWLVHLLPLDATA